MGRRSSWRSRGAQTRRTRRFVPSAGLFAALFLLGSCDDGLDKGSTHHGPAGPVLAAERPRHFALSAPAEVVRKHSYASEAHAIPFAHITSMALDAATVEGVWPARDGWTSTGWIVTPDRSGGVELQLIDGLVDQREILSAGFDVTTDGAPIVLAWRRVPAVAPATVNEGAHGEPSATVPDGVSMNQGAHGAKSSPVVIELARVSGSAVDVLARCDAPDFARPHAADPVAMGWNDGLELYASDFAATREILACLSWNGPNTDKVAVIDHPLRHFMFTVPDSADMRPRAEWTEPVWMLTGTYVAK